MVPGGLILGLDIGGTSIKGVLLEGGREAWRGRSAMYARPSVPELEHEVRGLVGAAGLAGTTGKVARIGLCAPGLRGPGGVVTKAVNLPGLVGESPAKLVTGAARELAGARVVESTDAYAAAVDYWRQTGQSGRLLALSMGTGVGACVLDGDGEWPRPVIVTGRGPGQIGQMDVGEGAREQQPIGPDGGRGTLEAYWGFPALRARFGDDPATVRAALGGLGMETVLMRVLVRALRVAHAIYLPERIALLGGVGLCLTPRAAEVRQAVADGLTPLAKPKWTLACAMDEFHAARGAAAVAIAGHEEGSGRLLGM